MTKRKTARAKKTAKAPAPSRPTVSNAVKQPPKKTEHDTSEPKATTKQAEQETAQIATPKELLAEAGQIVAERFGWDTEAATTPSVSNAPNQPPAVSPADNQDASSDEHASTTDANRGTQQDLGVVTSSVDGTAGQGGHTRTREGENRGQCWERLRQEARTAGLTRRDAISYAGREIDRIWPLDGSPGVDPQPPEAAEPEPKAPEPVEVTDKVTDPAESGVTGLGDLPDGWPELPANASLQVEVSWVSANRLRVRDGFRVDLTRSLSPAPSHSALSWLETSILFPAKFSDVAVKVTSTDTDEREHVRREKLAIEDVNGLLAEMAEGST